MVKKYTQILSKLSILTTINLILVCIFIFVLNIIANNLNWIILVILFVLLIVRLYFILPGEIEITNDKLYVFRFLKLMRYSISWDQIHLIEEKEGYSGKLKSKLRKLDPSAVSKVCTKDMELLLIDGRSYKLKLYTYYNSLKLYKNIMKKANIEK